MLPKILTIELLLFGNSILMKDLRRIYEGVPIELEKVVFWVADSYRINELSQIPGGSDIVIEYKCGDVLGYDKIKKPSSYIEAVLSTIMSFGDSDDIKILNAVEVENRNKAIKKYLIDAVKRHGGLSTNTPIILMPNFGRQSNGDWISLEQIGSTPKANDQHSLLGWITVCSGLSLEFHFINTQFTDGYFDKLIAERGIQDGESLPSEVVISQDFLADILLRMVKAKVKRVFARKQIGELENQSASFKEVWNSTTANRLPWQELVPFD